jgi:SulP family sulfate permease
VIALREGYSFRRFGHDALAGLTVSNVGKIAKDFEDGSEEIGETLSDLKDPESVSRADVPLGVEVYEIAGPFFFGVADRLKDTLNQFERPPRVFVLRMRKVPAIDATGLHALKEFHTTRRRRHIRLILCGVHAQSLFAIVQAGFDRLVGAESMFETLHDALGAARGPVAREASGVGAP